MLHFRSWFCLCLKNTVHVRVYFALFYSALLNLLFIQNIFFSCLLYSLLIQSLSIGTLTCACLGTEAVIFHIVANQDSPGACHSGLSFKG